MKIVVIIPSYNERDNVEPMVRVLAEERMKIANHDLEVLYVDDSSPDGTADEIKRLQKDHKWLYLLLREKKQGLGAAYVAGMRYAMEKLKADVFIEFDADFQHDPEEIKKLVAAFDEGYDYVIGSRYIKGGSIPPEWEFKRKFLSVVGNLVARVLLLLPQIHDVTTGFKLTRVEGFVNKLSLEIPRTPPAPSSSEEGVSLSLQERARVRSTLISTSFAYKIQLLHEMVQAGAKVKEVPIKFLSRAKGESKIIKNELFETLRVIFVLQSRNSKIRQFVKFGITGFIGYLVQAGTLFLLSKITMPEWLRWGGSAEAAIISNFTINNHWTFKADKITGVSKVLTKFLHFNATSVGAIVIQIVAGSGLVYLFGPEYRQLYLPIIIGFLIVPYNYFVYTRFIWKR